jgi:hypothetical protein
LGVRIGAKKFPHPINLGRTESPSVALRPCDQVPILPKVTNIGLQIFLTRTLNIFVTFNQNSLVGHVFCNHFEPVFWKNTCKIC